eukprot:CAMPEP_0118867146 /NCGR_PEP_ID=MMETSP1163-20130328/10837_1 /TAXON_ID=124430 /ORGANISM="Phaeomonas parva, Strain CCMP2877" /LENGTH=253 /DNA_ID=CAMNT_0006801527 /DNA_START=64 /DNA_END=825 /DNA_ORIENTATION=-
MKRERSGEDSAGAEAPKAKRRAGAAEAEQPRMNVTNRCWARTAAGRNCGAACSRDDGIPYCKVHFKRGDSAVKVVAHDEHPEIFGNVLVATQDLPKGYKFIYWGDLLRSSELRKRQHAMEHVIEFCPNPYTNQVRGTIDPTAHPEGSVLQYAMMPGPGECVNMAPTWTHFGRYGKNGRTPLAARVYKLTRPVPKGQQISHDYGSGWMECRGIKKMNCGTKKYPMPLKKPRKPRKPRAAAPPEAVEEAAAVAAQ